MYREILNDLKKWKDKSRRKPLILTGVRQCGKTYIVDDFARSNFESYVYVNFELRRLFLQFSIMTSMLIG